MAERNCSHAKANKLWQFSNDKLVELVGDYVSPLTVIPNAEEKKTLTGMFDFANFKDRGLFLGCAWELGPLWAKQPMSPPSQNRTLMFSICVDWHVVELKKWGAGVKCKALDCLVHILVRPLTSREILDKLLMETQFRHPKLTIITTLGSKLLWY